LSYNFIIYDNFSDFSKIVNKSFEGYIAAHQLKNELNDKFNGFNHYLLTLLITYGDPKFLNKILIRYNVKELNIDNFESKALIDMIKRLSLSVETIQSIIANDNKEKGNYFFRDKINKNFSNLFLLISRLPLSKKQLNQILETLLKFLPSATFVHPTLKDYLKEVILYQSDRISIDNYKRLLRLCLFNKKWRELNLIENIIGKIHSSQFGFIISDKDLIAQIFELTDKNNHTWDLSDIGVFWKIASPDFKKKIKKIILTRLNNNFDYRLYYNSVIDEIIDYKPFWDEFIKSVPKYPNETSFIEAFGGKDDFKIYRLNLLIDIAYKYNIDLTDEKYQTLHEGIPYYKWLLNLEKFNYSQFNPYWILMHKSIHYFQTFSRHAKIVAATQKSINENYNEGLAKVYFAHFAKVNL